jgi:predicted nucleic acid-binding protein
MSDGSFVLDTTVTLGALFKDEQYDYSLAVLGTLDYAVAVVPSLWHQELGNILGRAIKAKRMTAADLDESWERLGSLGIKTVPILDDARFWAERAVEWGLSTYDCCYLELARQQRLPLATKDASLANAAKRIGVGLYLS